MRGTTVVRTDDSAGAILGSTAQAAAVDHRAALDVLQRFAGTLVDDYDLDEVLERLGADIRRILAVAGAGIMLSDDDGHLHFLSTSDPKLEWLEQLQIKLGEGPCLRAYRTAEVVIVPDLRDDPRFPAFAPRALDVGMAAVYSFPMRISDAVVGATNLYNEEPGALSDDQIVVGQTLAHVATCYLTHARDLGQRELVTAQLQQALHQREIIEQAKGYVARARGVGLVEAFELLRTYARSRQLKLRIVARAVVHGDLEPEELDR